MDMSDFSIFSVMGIELEYMLVDKDTLDVCPKSDIILKSLAGKQVNEVDLGEIAMSNELVMHVLELKDNGPKPPDAPITELFYNALTKLQPLLDQHHMMLLPTGAHPWMNPNTETVRWPHSANTIYNQFDAIFDCKGHGWSNLQSMHINLPYANQEEFYQLHNVIRLILPLLPALSASTPILDGKVTGLLDTRLFFYGTNQQRLPKISGDIIPEFIRTEEEYHDSILEPMYQQIKPYDPDGILQYPWLNSRGAIPKFNPKAIEIRIIDSQDCILGDIAIAKAVFELLKHWQKTSPYYLEHPCDTLRLKGVYDNAIKKGFSTCVDDNELLHQWNLPKKTMTLRDIWSFLIEQISPQLEFQHQNALDNLLTYGNLSERILRATGSECTKKTMTQVYRQLGECLLENRQFIPK